VSARGGVLCFILWTLYFISAEGNCVASGIPAKFAASVFGDTAYITIRLQPKTTPKPPPNHHRTTPKPPPVGVGLHVANINRW